MLFKFSLISYIRVTFNLGKTQLCRMWSKRVVNMVRRYLSVQLKLTVCQLLANIVKHGVAIRE